MIEPLFLAAETNTADTNQPPSPNPDEILRRMLSRAIGLSIESAFVFGIDVPVGAVAATDREIVGRYFASDVRTGDPLNHAERMAIDYDWAIAHELEGTPAPTYLVVSLEPCTKCQDFLARIPTLQCVGFGISRHEAAERGLVTPRESIFERVKKDPLSYDVVQIDNSQLKRMGLAVLDNTTRVPSGDGVVVDRIGLRRDLNTITRAKQASKASKRGLQRVK